MKNYSKKNIKITIFFFILLIFIILLYGLTEVTSSEVELTVVTESISFTLSKDWWFNSVKTQQLCISHFQKIDFSSYFMQDPIIRTIAPCGQSSKYLKKSVKESLNNIFPIIPNNENSSVNFKSKSFNLELSKIDSGTILTLISDNELKNQFTIRIDKGQVEGVVDHEDSLVIQSMNCKFGKKARKMNTEIHEIQIQNGGQLIFNDLNQKINIVARANIGLLKSSSFIIGERIPINKIEFAKIEDGQKESSIVMDGMIYFTDIDSLRKGIKAGDFVILNGLQNAQIKRISLEDGLHIIFYGKVTECKTGIKSFCYSRLPTKIEWFYVNKIIAFYFAAIAGIYTLIMSLLKLREMIKKN